MSEQGSAFQTQPLSLKERIFAIQGAVSKVNKDGKNPHTNSTYPTLEAVLDAINGLIQDHKLVLWQRPLHKEYGWVLETALSVASDEVSDTLITEVPLLGLDDSKNKMQALGSAITYARRYALMAIFKLAPTDDDGSAIGPSKELQIVKEKARPAAPAKKKPDLKIADGKYRGRMASSIPWDELIDYLETLDKALKTRRQRHPNWLLDLKKWSNA